MIAPGIHNTGECYSATKATRHTPKAFPFLPLYTLPNSQYKTTRCISGPLQIVNTNQSSQHLSTRFKPTSFLLSKMEVKGPACMPCKWHYGDIVPIRRTPQAPQAPPVNSRKASSSIAHVPNKTLSLSTLELPNPHQYLSHQQAGGDSLIGIQSVLAFELPDPDQDLFVQHPGRGATQFPRFSELPTEIRLMIWRAAFRGPKLIPLIAQWYTRSLTYRPPHPITLHVSRESRAETLKHYMVFFLDVEECLVASPPGTSEYEDKKWKKSILKIIVRFSAFLNRRIWGSIFYPHKSAKRVSISWRKRLVPRVICLNTKTDTLMMNFYQNHLYQYPTYHHHLLMPRLLAFAREAKKYSPITKLVITGITNHEFNDTFWGGRERKVNPGITLPPSFQGLICHHNLEELWIVSRTLVWPHYLEECRLGMRQMFEWEQKRFPECKIPEIIFIGSVGMLKARIREELSGTVW
jgi:hypothetical protein